MGSNRGSDRLVLSPALRIENPPSAAPATDIAPEATQPELTSPVDDTPFVNSLKEDLMPLRENLPSFLQKRVMQSSASESPEPNQEPNEVEAEDVGFEPTQSPFEEELSAEASISVVDHLGDAENTLPFPAPEDLTFESARKDMPQSDAAPFPQDVADDIGAADQRPWEIEGERLSEWHSTRSASLDDAEALDFEPDGPEDGANAGTSVAALKWEDHESEPQVTEPPVFESQAFETQTFETHEPAEEVVPDIEFVTEVAPETMQETAQEVAPSRPTSDHRDPVTEHISEKVVEEIAASEDTIDAQQYDAVLDEEMLRELVGEIVRQELQGPLGERITRNVRKLVRREINRALTARSFTDG